MSEQVFCMVDERLEYSGLFSMKEVFRILDKYYRQKGWDKKIMYDEEYDTPTGKYIHVKFTPYKKVDDYIRAMNRIWIYVHDLVEVEKEVDGKKVLTNKGRISLMFDGMMMTDYRNNWVVTGKDGKTKWGYFLLQTAMEKWFYRKRLAHWEGVIRHTLIGAKTEVAGYLNLNKYFY
ncbi:MAG: hypothetical protein KKF44_02490 [Nanoarchaeota archaeon]|nr:hypothetical protein [Nanoarchaeota archaeon]